MPYKVRTDMDEIEMKCELCLDLPCCPEHCCDVSNEPFPSLNFLCFDYSGTLASALHAKVAWKGVAKKRVAPKDQPPPIVKCSTPRLGMRTL